MKREIKCGAVVTAAAKEPVNDEHGRFVLEKSRTLENWWVLTDTVNLVVVRFEENNFNESQKVTFLDDSVVHSDELTDGEAANLAARIMREIGEYMAHFAEIAI